MRRALVVLSMCLAGCLGPRADPSAYFLLSPAPTPAEGGPLQVVVGIGPVTIPGYLDRPQIVVRVSDNEVAVSEVDRWAEPLGANLARVLQENLSLLLPSSTYVDYPWYESDAPDYGVGLDVRRFESDATGAVVLEATWRLTGGGSALDGGTVRIDEAAVAVGRAPAVAAQSRALAELSRQIAAAVRRAEERAPANLRP
ncbi:MAG: PqiC family protein [Gemmatimonadota bacterium]|nr:PqiC family protein [Gemmatimonadota bacterium]MDH3423446.1 PqiC family protein [Gemmatimonadota bacterium]